MDWTVRLRMIIINGYRCGRKYNQGKMFRLEGLTLQITDSMLCNAGLINVEKYFCESSGYPRHIIKSCQTNSYFAKYFLTSLQLI